MISPFGFFSPRTFASSSRAAVAANPEKSDRAIAEEIGIHHSTVNEARKRSTAGNPTVEKRTGRDGKTRRMPQVPRAASVDSSGLYFSRAARWHDLMKTPLGGQTERRRYLHDESNLPTCQGGQTAMNDTSTPTRPAAQVASSPRRRWRVEPTPLSESERMARRARRIRLERAALIVSKTYTDCTTACRSVGLRDIDAIQSLRDLCDARGIPRKHRWGAPPLAENPKVIAATSITSRRPAKGWRVGSCRFRNDEPGYF